MKKREICFIQGYVNFLLLIKIFPLLFHIQVSFKIIFQPSPYIIKFEM